MKKRFEVVQVGLGPMGKLITQLILKRENISFKGVVDIDPEFVGKKLGKLFGDEKGSNIIIESDLSCEQ